MKSAPLALLALAAGLAGVLDLPAQPARDGGRASHGERASRRAAGSDSEPEMAPAGPAADPVFAPTLELVAKFDRDGDGRLDSAERAAARDHLAASTPPASPAAPRHTATAPIAPARVLEPVRAGEKADPARARSFPDRPLYDPATLRTITLQFEDADWERQLALFAPTDVWVPATLTVDGRTYAGVGVRFAPLPTGATREPGYHRSLDVRLDFTDPGQRIAGERTLHLVDAHDDPTNLRTALYFEAARDGGPAPRTAFVTLAINGENWGVYTNVQPFDDALLRENFGTAAGARWIVPAGGGLTYLGDDPQPYRAIYRLQTPESPEAWRALIALCKTIAETPPEYLNKTLPPILDVNGTLRFLALENALLNQSGYRATGGGYGLYLDPSGRFHLVPLAGAASFRLVETQVVATGFRRRPGDGESRDRRRPAAGSPGATANVAAKTSGTPARQTPSAAPRPASTDLAMMLSYSLVLKADRDDDQSVTRDEWLDFARGWFTVMDENYAGQVTRAQFIEKFRWFVTPPSMRDGKSRQTYGKDDPAEIIGDEFFTEMDQDRDGNVAREEFARAFARWFDRWGDARTHRLAQGQIQAGLEKLIADHVFTADPVEIAKRDKFIVNDDPRDAGRSGDEAGRDERGGGRGAGGGSGLSVGLPIPGLRLGTDSFRRRSEGGSGGGRTLVTQREQLEVLAGMDDPRRALLNKLFDAPGLRWRYLGYLHDVAQRWLAWDRVGEIAKRYQALLADEVRRDTHKPDSYEHFVQRIDQDETDADNDEPSLKKIVTDRQRYVLDDEAVQRHADGK